MGRGALKARCLFGEVGVLVLSFAAERALCSALGEVAGRLSSSRLTVSPPTALRSEPGGRYVMPMALCSLVISYLVTMFAMVISPAELLEVYGSRRILVTTLGLSG